MRPVRKPDSDHSGPATAPLRRIRVLLADDHDLMRQVLVNLLESQVDIEIAGEAADGEAAVDLALSLHPDVVLMDVNMPVMNGIEATSRISRNAPDIRVIGLSMYIESFAREAMRRAGARAYLAKDETVEKLLAAIRDADLDR